MGILNFNISFQRQTSKVAAMVELVNFILMVRLPFSPCFADPTSLLILVFVLQAAGAKKKWIASDVDLEALEPEELDILVRL